MVKEVNKIEISKKVTFKDLAPPQLFCDWITIEVFFGFIETYSLGTKKK